MNGYFENSKTFMHLEAKVKNFNRSSEFHMLICYTNDQLCVYNSESHRSI
jgi:hypothetical protein